MEGPGSTGSDGESVVIIGRATRSDLEQLGLLGLDEPLDEIGVLLGQAVELLLGARAVVLADLAVLDEPVEIGLRLAPDVADRDTSLLRLVVRQLDVLAATLLGQLGHDAADLVAVAARVDPEVGVADRALDGLHRRLVERDDEDGARLGVLEGGELLQRGRGAVVLDRELVEQPRVGAAGADAREVLLEDLDGLVHLLLGLEHRLFDHGSLASSSLVRGLVRLLLVLLGLALRAGSDAPEYSGVGDERADLLTEQGPRDVSRAF